MPMINQDQAIFMNETKPLSRQDSKRVIKVEMFKAGPQLDSEGDYKVFSISDLDDVVKTYNPKKHEAPLIVGHEHTDSTPSLGWVQKLWREGKSLMGAVELTPRAEKMIRDGTFRKISSSFYTPDAPTNPVPGKMSLRHLALVSIPAVKGLADFSEELEKSHFINISNNFSENLVKDYLDKKSKTMGRRRKKSVSDHAEITISISDGTNKPLTYDDSGTQLDSMGNVADYTDDRPMPNQSPENEYPPELHDVNKSLQRDVNAPAMPDEEEDKFDKEDAFADDPLAENTGGGEEELPVDSPEEDMNLEDDQEDMDTDMEDISEDMEDEDDKIAELAANYTHQQLYQALQLQEEARSSLGSSSDFSETPDMDMENSYSEDNEEEEDEDEDNKESEEKTNSDKSDDKKPPFMQKKDKKDCNKDYEEGEDEGDDDIESLKDRVQQLEEELMKQKRMAREKEVSDFCESLYSQGKLTEKIVNRKDLSKFLVTLNSKNAVNFSEGGKQSQYRFMKSLLKRLPGVVSFKEVASPKSAPQEQRKQFAPEADGYTYDNNSLDTHKKALSYSEKHGVDYITALKTILE